jgi:glycosyltransferase involved in cell wall biosynthesis
LKILFFNWRDIKHPQAGGCELNLHEIAKRLVKKEHKVTIFSGAYSGCKEQEIIDGIEIIRKGGKFSVYFFASLEYLSNFKKKNYDIIIDDINGIPFFTPLYIKKPKVAILHHLVKDIFSKELIFPLTSIGYLAEWLIPKIYKKIDFVTVSESSKNEMMEAGIKSEKINVIHNGISRECKPNIDIKTDYPSILFVGRLKEYKQIDVLIEAIKIVKKDKQDVKLFIGGTGDKESDLKNLVNKLGLNDTVKFHGYVDENKKLELYQKSWIFVTPSIKEGWGITVIEANACGTPAISFDVPGLRDSIKNNVTGILVNKMDINNLANNILEVLNDNNLRNKLQNNAINWSREFTWDNATEKMIELLENVITSENIT